ncbi:MAG: hypothetical protein PSV22_09635 [Pseudolabrys sp.]|nr:hypothetical protein [Pseudolabrys sp.]
MTVLTDAMYADPAFAACAAEAARRERTAQRRAGIVKTSLAPPAAAPAPGKKAGKDELPPAYVTNVYPLVRRDFNDVWLFDQRKGVGDIEDAEGASFSVASDRIANNTTWNVNAMGAVVFQVLHDRYPKGQELNFIGLSLAPFVTINRTRNSNPNAVTNNVDEVKYGGSAEFGLDIAGTAQYFRVQGAALEDRIASTTSSSANFEWIPVIDGLINSPIETSNSVIPVSFVFGPEYRLRYDNVVANDLTGAKEKVWRSGPQGILRYKVIGTALPDTLKDIAFLKSLHGQTTFGWLSSAGTGQYFSYFSSSLTYNLDPDGHLGLTGSYTNGRSEDTGRRIDLWKAGLTAKW